MSNLSPTNQGPWRKSSRSQSGNCVEVSTGGAVLVRDSKNVAGPVLQFTGSAWRAFVHGAPEVPDHLRVTA